LDVRIRTELHIDGLGFAGNRFCMPGDPNECRRHAENCRRLAEQATRPDAREHFLTLAGQWERLASELEAAKVFLATMSAIEPIAFDPSADPKV
jgi:hypothetical protein